MKIRDINKIIRTLKGPLDYYRVAEEILKLFNLKFIENHFSLSQDKIKKDILKMIAKKEKSENIIKFLDRVEMLIFLDKNNY